MTDKIKIRNIFIVIGPRKFDTADIKCFTVDGSGCCLVTSTKHKVPEYTKYWDRMRKNNVNKNQGLVV